MGRLDDIIERNKHPKASFRKSKPAPGATEPTTDDRDGASAQVVEPKRGKPILRRAKAEPAPRPATQAVNQAEQGEQKGRLDRIIARNEKPDANYRWLKVGLAGIVLFVVLVLLIFTDLAAPPDAAYPPARVQVKPSGVDGVKLWKAPVKKPGATK